MPYAYVEGVEIDTNHQAEDASVSNKTGENVKTREALRSPPLEQGPLRQPALPSTPVSSLSESCAGCCTVSSLAYQRFG